ncbi:heavy metal translocating P-type ATPase, partial [bacterium]|nr:heavy metal translocating P-type ATPase [bacterium]
MPTSQQHRTTAANSTTVIDKSSQGIASLVWQRRHGVIAVFTLVCIAAYLLLGYSSLVTQASAVLPLWMALIVGGGPLVLELSLRLIRREFGSDLLAGISIVTALLLDQY